MGYSRMMVHRIPDRFRLRVARIALLATGALLPAACSTANEVVFDGTPAPPSSNQSPSVADALPTDAREADITTVTTAPITTLTTPATTVTTVTTVAGQVTNPTLALSERPVEVLPGQIVVNDVATSSVTILGPRPGQVEPFVALGESLQQPTWSPDGEQVAWSGAGGPDGYSVMVRSSDGGETNRYSTPFAVFYMQWRPDGRAIALLGASEPGQVGLAVLDLDGETVTSLNSSSSYYFHWSPQGTDLVTHLGGTRLEQLDSLTGDSFLFEVLDPVNSAFQAPSWMPDGESILYVKPAGADSVGAQDELVRYSIDTGKIEVLAEGAGFFTFAPSPDGRTVAYSVRNLDGITTMEVVDLESGGREEIKAPSTLAWQWSPDSRKILLLGVGDQAMSVGVYEAGRISFYQEIIPTSTFLQNYLYFWSQYDLSHSLWAPDSSAFVFPAIDGRVEAVFLQYLDDDLPVLLGPGSMAIFSPAASDL